MNHLFSVTPSVDIQRSAFDRSSTLKTAFDSSYLVPIYLDEVLPGDTFNLQASLFCRMATPIVPVMDNLYLETFWFFIPHRLVWNNFTKMMGEQEDPDDSIDFTVPQTLTGNGSTAKTVVAQSLADYLGCPIGTLYGPNKGVNALPFRSYYLCYNEFFRDENLQDSIKINKGDSGVFVPVDVQGNPPFYVGETRSILKRNKRFDYFTACLPTPVKFQSMTLPLAGSAPVFGTGKTLGVTNGTDKGGLYQDTGGDHFLQVSDGNYGISPGAAGDGSTRNKYDGKAIGVISKTQAGDNPENSGLYADLSAVTAVTVSDLRTAFQIQRLLEAQNRSGTRYVEILAGQFHVWSGDARLQRPEFLGSSSCRINVNPVQQTSSTDATTPQGNLAAYGVAADRFTGFVKSFVEHGYILGLVNVRADLNYQQGLNKLWSRKTRFDFYWPTLAHLSEQAVLNKEIYLQGTSDDEDVFGYQERWAEYRYKPNMITGKMRSTYSSPLDIWHLAQKFDSLPVLNDSFIQENPPVSRVVAVPSEPEFLLDAYFKCKCVRPMPVYSIPGLIDHF